MLCISANYRNYHDITCQSNKKSDKPLDTIVLNQVLYSYTMDSHYNKLLGTSEICLL